MLAEELKKLYIKHFGLILTLLIIVGEIVTLNLSYHKREFVSSSSERQFYSYMEDFSGKLTQDRKAAILTEQERIVDAQNIQSGIEKKLIKGEYNSENEFLAEYSRVREITDRKESFDIVMEQYYYAEKAPEQRYLTSGDYSALGQDIPDILLLTGVILLSALLFLNEETSNVITFIRIGENGRNKTLLGKITALLLFVFSCQSFRTVFELIAISSQGNSAELSYPIQSIEFFQNCPYNISIIQGFFAISAMRAIGYLFIAALVLLLSVTIRKMLFTVFIPSAVCILQQFVFTPPTPAYYIPTGLLRAVGYLRGDVLSKDGAGDEIKMFSEIPLGFLVALLIVTSIFIFAAVWAASAYYSGGAKKKLRVMSVVSMIGILISMCVLMSGCSVSGYGSFQSPDCVKYNLDENIFFVEGNDSFYTTDTKNIIEHFKNGNNELPLIHGLESNGSITALYNNGDRLLYLHNFAVNGISLADYTDEFYHTLKESDTAGFLGINLSSQGYKSKSVSYLAGFFTANGSLYYVFDNRVLKDGVCVIDEASYNSALCCDGKSIYYVNKLLQLKRYDMKTGEISRLSGEFVRTVYYDGKNVLYSDKNGIFMLDTSDFSASKISDIPAERLCSNGRIVIYQKDGLLYRLGKSEAIYDKGLLAYAITDNDLLVIRNRDFSCKTIDLMSEGNNA